MTSFPPGLPGLLLALLFLAILLGGIIYGSAHLLRSRRKGPGRTPDGAKDLDSHELPANGGAGHALNLRLRALINASGEGLFEADEKLRLLQVNRQFCEWTGIIATEALGRPLAAFLKEESRPLLDENLRALQQGQCPVSVEVRLQGEKNPTCRLTLTPLILDHVLRVVGALTTLEGEQIWREQVMIQRQRFQRLSQLVQGGYWEWDIRTDRVYFDPRWKSQLGYEDHELLNDVKIFDSILHRSDRTRIISQVQRHFEEGGTNEMEMRLLKKNGTYQWVNAYCEATLSEDGKVIGFSGITRVTDGPKDPAVIATLADSPRSPDTPSTESEG